jgi:Holliday junction resolvasome RuvABC ATP-dependent DNA helicase subunit
MESGKIKIDLVAEKDAIIENPSFENVIGQEEVVRKLKFFLRSHRQNLPFPSMLFTGSHGLGKTYVAKILASNMGRRFLEINCATVVSTKEFIENILLEKIMGMKPVVVLLDEAHKLSGEVTTLLLSLIAPNDKGENVLEYRSWEIHYDLTKISTVFATTDSFKIFPPLVNRCETIYFRPYSNIELIKMLRFYLGDISLSDFTNADLEDLAYACRGRGRDTYALAQKIKRMVIDGKFTVLQWQELKDIFGIYPMGLNAQELQMLRIIRTNGATSCATIATRMMVGEENVSDEIEIRPKELWLITNTPRGRILTDRGEEYFNNLIHESETQSLDKLEGR